MATTTKGTTEETPEEDDPKFIESLKRGDQAAYERFVEEHHARVVGACYRFLGNAEDAEDAAQEAFIEVYRSIEDFRSDARLSTWIYRIAISKSLDALRARRRKKRFAVVKSLFEMLEVGQDVAAPAHIRPDAVLEDSERRRILREALVVLPEKQAAAMVLCKYEEFSNKEAAAILELTEGAVESLLVRAMRTLRENLKDTFEELIR